MARKTDGELVDELTTATTRQGVLLDVARKEIEILRDQRESLNTIVGELKTEFARVQTQIQELSIQINGRVTRLWATANVVVAALLGAALTFVVQRFLLGK